MARALDRVPKLCGADVEVGNFILGAGHADTADAAARLLLREIAGILAERSYGDCQPVYGYGVPAAAPSAFVNAQDQGRKYLPTNGSSAYIDLAHTELATAETISAFDHVAIRHALLRVAQRAQTAANAKLPRGQTLQVLLNNSDGKGNSYGSHLSFLLTRRAWENLFERRLHHLLYLAAYQVSSIVFTGAGKVGAENGAAAVDYQIAQRADFFETLVGMQTTYRRPIVNARDEALSGATTWDRPSAASGKFGRLHSIFFDSTLCHGSTLLGVGVMQIMLAMIEAERIDPRMILDEPLAALLTWSHDPELRARARTASGRKLTAVELQLSFLEQARRFVEAGGCEGIVPRAEEIVALWADTLERLRARDFATLARRLDWVLKLQALRRARERRPHLTWASPEMKMLDLRYASLDASDGLYWAYERAGAVERVVSEAEIVRFETEPPEDTRAWTRAMLLRLAGRSRIDGIDWDWLRFKPAPGRWISEYVDLPDPLGFTKAEVGHLFEGTPTLDDVLTALQATPAPPERHLAVVAGTSVH
jgi:proteasome accessory factor A